jgi:hypothetical protein
MEISRIQKLEKSAFWSGASRPSGAIYFDDSLKFINNVGKVTINKLKQAGINNIIDLISIIDDQKAKNAFDSGLSVSKINTIIAND